MTGTPGAGRGGSVAATTRFPHCPVVWLRPARAGAAADAVQYPSRESTAMCLAGRRRATPGTATPRPVRCGRDNRPAIRVSVTAQRSRRAPTAPRRTAQRCRRRATEPASPTRAPGSRRGRRRASPHEAPRYRQHDRWRRTAATANKASEQPGVTRRVVNAVYLACVMQERSSSGVDGRGWKRPHLRVRWS